MDDAVLRMRGATVVRGPGPILADVDWTVRAGERLLRRRARADGSYASSNDPRVLAGLGSHEGPVAVDVEWPDGARESFPDVPTGRYNTLRRGEGRETR